MKFEDYIKKNIFIEKSELSSLIYTYVHLFKNNPNIIIDFFYKTDFAYGEYFIVYKYTESVYGKIFTRYFYVYDIFYNNKPSIHLNKPDIIENIKFIKYKKDLLKEIDSYSDSELIVLLNNYIKK